MMVDRFKLIAGPYSAPPFELGDVVTDELRGDVRITAISDGRIQWPKGRRLDQTGGYDGGNSIAQATARGSGVVSGRSGQGTRKVPKRRRRSVQA